MEQIQEWLPKEEISDHQQLLRLILEMTQIANLSFGKSVFVTSRICFIDVAAARVEISNRFSPQLMVFTQILVNMRKHYGITISSSPSY